MGSGTGACKMCWTLFFLSLYDSTQSSFQRVRRQPEPQKPSPKDCLLPHFFFLEALTRKQKGTLRLGEFERLEPGQEAKKGQDRACSTSTHGKSSFWVTKQSLP